MLTKHDLSHMGRNRKETRLITSQPPLLSVQREEKKKKKTTRQSKGREARAMENGAWRTLVPCRVWVNSSL